VLCAPPRQLARAGIAIVSFPGTPSFPPGDAFAGGVGVIPKIDFQPRNSGTLAMVLPRDLARANGQG